MEETRSSPGRDEVGGPGERGPEGAAAPAGSSRPQVSTGSPHRKTTRALRFPNAPKGERGSGSGRPPAGGQGAHPGKPRTAARPAPQGRLTRGLSRLESAEACTCTRPRCPRTEVKTPEGSREGCARGWLDKERPAGGAGWHELVSGRPRPRCPSRDRTLQTGGFYHVQVLSQLSSFYRNQSSKLSF